MAEQMPAACFKALLEALPDMRAAVDAGQWLVLFSGTGCSVTLFRDRTQPVDHYVVDSKSTPGEPPEVEHEGDDFWVALAAWAQYASDMSVVEELFEEAK